MSAPFTESIWDTVSRDGFRWRSRSQPVNALLWHITGSGHADNPSHTEYIGTKNWFTNPNNHVRDPRYPDYAGMAHVLIGPAGICEVVRIADAIPAFSSYPSDEHALSIEVALSVVGAVLTDPDADRVMANCKLFADWACPTYGIERGRRRPYIEGLSDQDWWGEAGHYDTTQGRASGHIDPGEPWWAAYLQEEQMTPEQAAQLQACYDALVGRGNPAGIARLVDWNARGNSLLDGFTIEQKKLAGHEHGHYTFPSVPVLFRPEDEVL